MERTKKMEKSSELAHHHLLRQSSPEEEEDEDEEYCHHVAAMEEVEDESPHDADLRYRRRNICRRRTSLAWWVWLGALQLVNVIVFLLWENRPGIALLMARISGGEVASDFHALLTKTTSIPYLGIEEGYWTRLTNASFWSYILTPKNGVVLLDNTLLPALNLKLAPRPTKPPLLPAGSEGKSLYQVAAFHSLHCLEMIHSRLQDDHALVPRDCGALEWGGYVVGTGPGEVNETLVTACHVLHCVDWLRQDVMCLADSTLEPFVVADQTRGHQCRDFDAVRRWAVRNQWPGGMRDLQAFG